MNKSKNLHYTIEEKEQILGKYIPHTPNANRVWAVDLDCLTFRGIHRLIEALKIIERGDGGKQ